MSLGEFIRLDYAYRYGLSGAPLIDPVTDCAASIPADQLTAERDRLIAVQERCIVSKTAREFLDRVIALKG